MFRLRHTLMHARRLAKRTSGHRPWANRGTADCPGGEGRLQEPARPTSLPRVCPAGLPVSTGNACIDWPTTLGFSSCRAVRKRTSPRQSCRSARNGSQPISTSATAIPCCSWKPSSIAVNRLGLVKSFRGISLCSWLLGNLDQR